jgi:hypothetical protein
MLDGLLDRACVMRVGRSFQTASAGADLAKLCHIHCVVVNVIHKLQQRNGDVSHTLLFGLSKTTSR